MSHKRPLTITHAISIVNDGGTASVLVPSGGTGITITAGTSDVVSLRGLTIEGAGVGQTGIQFNTGQSLTIENCVIRHVTLDGIDFFPSATSKRRDPDLPGQLLQRQRCQRGKSDPRHQAIADYWARLTTPRQ